MGTHYQHHETKQEVPSYNTNLNGMITTTTTDAKTNAQEHQHQQQHSSEPQKKQSDAEIMIEAINALCRNASYSCLGAVATFEEPLKLPPSAVDDRCDDDMDVEVMISSDDKSNGGGMGWSHCDREKGGFMKKRKKKSNLVRDPVYSKMSNDLDVSVESSKDWMDVNAPITSNTRSSSAPSLLNAGAASSINDSFDENRHVNDASRRNVNLSGFGDVMWHEDDNNGAVHSGSICGKMPRRSSLSTSKLIFTNLFVIYYVKNAYSFLYILFLDDLIEMKNNLQKRQRRRVSLARAVSVVPIPSRTEYPDAVRSAIWSSPVEMYQNAARNSIEFAAEGWNWRTVYDDDTMCLNSENGELVHPIHYYLNNLDGVDAYSPPAVDNSCATKA